MNRTILQSALLTVSFSFVGTTSHIRSDEKAKPPDAKELREMLNSVEFRDERRLLIKSGALVFDTYLLILNDPKSKPLHVARIFTMLRLTEGDRSKFLEHALARLAHSDEGVRVSATALLAHIGNENNTASLHVLLSDNSLSVSCSAATTLSAIGNANDLHAMNVWLTIYKPRNLTIEQQNSHNAVREKVTQARDELKARLEKPKKPK